MFVFLSIEHVHVVNDDENDDVSSDDDLSTCYAPATNVNDSLIADYDEK
jgi:hypothetical protein